MGPAEPSSRDADHAVQVHRAVNDAEATCGLQFCAVLCGDDAPITDQIAEAFESIGVTVMPAVVVGARLSDGEIAVRLGSCASGRLSDDDVAEVLALCRPRDDESVKDHIAAVVLTLADRAGPGTADPDTPELPDVITR